MITGITFCLIVTMANLVVGAFVGLTGVAGFLLPITYTSLLGLGTTEGLALSFGALSFLVMQCMNRKQLF